jgi:acyl-CoA hydrolase
MSLKRTRWIRVTVEEDKKALLRRAGGMLQVGVGEIGNMVLKTV